MITTKLGCEIDLDTLMVREKYSREKYGIRCHGQRDGHYGLDSWWVNAEGVIYETTELDDAPYEWDNREDAEFALQHIKLMYGNYNITDEDWDDHN